MLVDNSELSALAEREVPPSRHALPRRTTTRKRGPGWGLAAWVTLAVAACDWAWDPEADADPVEPAEREPPPLVSPKEAEAIDDQKGAALGLRPRQAGGYDYRDPSGEFEARIDKDGTVSFRDLPRRDVGNPLDEGIRFGGLADWLRQGGDKQRHAAAKRGLLEKTQQIRGDLAQAWHQQQIDRQLAGLERDLKTIWSDPNRNPRQKRVQLFERWDECEEPASKETAKAVRLDEPAASHLERRRQAAGRQARQQIEAFIRERLGPDDPMAFTAEELRELNGRRHSRQRFDPYAARGK
ncbi:MAG: hypothetical protein B7733_00685 [Myxococcales bacterium FL481]|nr:MAG: hypothetical protein B7733_00685 [Myxococcales bacterium FL481]